VFWDIHGISDGEWLFPMPAVGCNNTVRPDAAAAIAAD